MRRAAVVLCLLSAACQTSTPTPPPSPETSRAAATLPEAIAWVADSAEYQALVRQTYAEATRRLRELAPGHTPGAWAVILDADETVISNIAFEKEVALSGKPYSPELWKAWTARREAPPLPGSIAFLEEVRRLGGAIAIVTNRADEFCDDTRADFRAHGIPFDVMLCRGDSRDKNPRFAEVADGEAFVDRQPREVLLWLGDNIRDFPGLDQSLAHEPDEAFSRFGSRYFVLPNPMYGSWKH